MNYSSMLILDKSFTIGCQKGAWHRSSHRTLRDQREAAVHVRLSGMQQALLQTLSPTDAQSQTYRYRDLQKDLQRFSVFNP